MRPKHLLISTVLVAPALFLSLASCSDSSKTPAEPSVPNAAAAKIAPNSQVAARPRINVAGALAARLSAAFTTTTVPLAPHDPSTVNTLVGSQLVCFSGTDVGPPFPGIYGGTGTRFRNNRGCEINTFSNDPDGAVAGAFPRNRGTYTGKLLTAINHLDFYYAGGPQIGGAPRLNIPIDECEDVTPTAAVTIATTGCAPGFGTDGFFDATAFIDQSNCNDGDFYVGALRGEDDLSCLVSYYDQPISGYPNWDAFAAAHPGARIARRYDAITSGTGRIEPADILIISDQPSHFLVYRARFD